VDTNANNTIYYMFVPRRGKVKKRVYYYFVRRYCVFLNNSWWYKLQHTMLGQWSSLYRL